MSFARVHRTTCSCARHRAHRATDRQETKFSELSPTSGVWKRSRTYLVLWNWCLWWTFLWRICALFWDARDMNKSKLGIASSNNEERAAQNGHEFSPSVTEKATANRSWGKSSFILIFMLIFKRFDTIVYFPGKFWKTLFLPNRIKACGKLCTELWATLDCFGTTPLFN